MLSRFLSSLVCAALLAALPHSAPAQNAHVAGAFLFAGRKDWPNALSHAGASRDPVLERLIAWEYLLDPDSQANFSSIAAFMRAYPQWPLQRQLQLRAEQALRFSRVDDGTLGAWFEAHPPISGVGKIHEAELLMRRGAAVNSEQVAFLLRDAWRNGDFDENEEQRILAAYGGVLREQDHIARADRLLWEEKIKSASRMLSLLPSDLRRTDRARIALLQGSLDAPFLYMLVPRDQRGQPGLLYARLLWHERRGDDAGVNAVLLSLPAFVPYSEKWWRAREAAVRKAIGEKDYTLARELLMKAGEQQSADAADADWLSGWLALEFTHDPHDAYLKFLRMTREAESLSGKARADYWTARAAEKLGDAKAAEKWYGEAARYPTTFYGQLASRRIGKAFYLPPAPVVSAAVKSRTAKNDLVRAARLSSDAHALETAEILINQAVDNARTRAETAAVVLLAASDSTALGVRAAKRALKEGVLLPSAAYPHPPLKQQEAEPAFVYSIIRQESEFALNAHSASGAIGLMQLLPSTAKETARRNGFGFRRMRLYEPGYNVQMGSSYLARLLRHYNGSYILTAAAYNAGPGRVRIWMSAFGAPGRNPEQAADWIETIPYAETRNYVLHVMENLEVYRSLLRASTPSPRRSN